MVKLLNNSVYKRIFLAILSLGFLFSVWNSTSFFSPYVIVCISAIICKPHFFSKTSLIGSSIISFLIAIANFDTINLWQGFIIIFTGTFIFDAIIQQLLHIELKERKRKSIFLISFICISSTYLIYLFVFNFPGTATIDSGEQVQQIISGNYWNHHPVWHTFTMQGIMSLMPTWLAKIAFYNAVQAVIFSAAISYGIEAIKNTKIIIPVILAFIVLPYHMNYAVTMTKDTLFTAGMVVFITSLYLHLKNEKLNKFQQLLFIISIFAVALYRTNGTVIIASTCIFSFFLLRKKNVLLPLLICLGISYFLKYPLLWLLDIPQPDLLESTVMFYQQVGRVAAKDGYITEQDYREIEKITSFNKFASLYVEDYADSIKHFLRFGGYGDFYTENKWNYFELWKRVGFNNPKLYIEAFIAQTRFWYNSGYDKWVVYNDNIPSVTPYFQDLLPTFPEKAHPSLQAFLKLKPFVSVGLHTWVLFVLTIVSFIKKDKKILLLIPFLTLLLTLILSAPTMEFRYMYSWFTILPILIPMLFKKEVATTSFFFKLKINSF